jgi:hypothetical protein
MKRMPTIAAVLMLLAGISSSAEGHRHDLGFVLRLAGSHNSLSPDSAVWKVGEPVRVIVMMVNHSKQVVNFSLTDPGWDWEMDVRDSSGKPVAETDLLRRIKESKKTGHISLARNLIGWVRPNEKAQDVVEVQMYYDLSQPGEYSIQVQRRFPGIAKDPIKSDRLMLTITP